MLEVCEVSKRYHTTLAVDRVSFQAQPGRVLGLLGPNGAGKSSILRMITNITHPDSGGILLDRERVTHETQARIGYMPEERGLYRQMRVLDQLVYLGQLKGLTVSRCARTRAPLATKAQRRGFCGKTTARFVARHATESAVRADPDLASACADS